MKKQWFVAIFTVAWILSVAFTPNALSQTPSPDGSSPRIQNLGVREIVSPIKDFCAIFQQELSARLGTQVRYVSIENEYRGRLFSRFQGLLDGLVDAECGPNSISAQYLINPNSDSSARYSEEIAFSNPFYETEIRLLLRNGLAEQLANMTEDELTERLKDLSIGLLENTTTLRQFQDRSQVYKNIRVFETTGNGTSESLEGKNSLEQALDALEGEEIEALASDGIILRSFLTEGIPGDNVDKQNTILFRRPRVPYESLGFSIFPVEGSLPGLNGEQYGIAVRRDEDTNHFQREVNSVLSNLNEPGSRLAIGRENIRFYELGAEPLPSDGSPEPTNAQVNPPPSSNESSGGEDEPKFLILAAIGFFSLLVVLAILRFKDSFRGQLSGPIGSLTIEGSNDNSKRPGINITDAISRQGSIQASENTGRGIDARKLDAQSNITLSSDKGSQLQLNDRLIDSGREEIGVDLSDIFAGRDVTVQQVVNDIGITHFNAGKNADVYVSLWESILSLKLALNDFFDDPSADSLSQLALQLKETRAITHKGGIFFKDSDRSRLFATLQDMGDVRVGRKLLKEIRSTDSMKEVSNSGIIIPSSRNPLNPISALTERLEGFKLDYESTIERLRPFFKEKLSL